MRSVLDDSKLDRELEARPFYDFADQVLAKQVSDPMVESGYAELLGLADRLEVRVGMDEEVDKLVDIAD